MIEGMCFIVGLALQNVVGYVLLRRIQKPRPDSDEVKSLKSRIEVLSADLFTVRRNATIAQEENARLREQLDAYRKVCLPSVM